MCYKLCEAIHSVNKITAMMKLRNDISDKAIGRLSLYRRLLSELLENGNSHVFSHELAVLAGCTPAQVRRDIMNLGVVGSPAKGYDIQKLIEGINSILDSDEPQKVALAGVGNLGRAILAYLSGRTSQFIITAAFDSDPTKVNRVIHGCRCYPVDELVDIVREENIQVGIVAVPASEAQKVVNEFCRGGVLGLMNFAPVRVRVPVGVYVENLDVMAALERVAFFARKHSAVRV